MDEKTNPNIFPTLRYEDASAAIDWLGRAFGFEEKAVYRGEDGTVHHAELKLGAGLVMLGQHRNGGGTDDTTSDPLSSTQGIYVVVVDPDAHHDRAESYGIRLYTSEHERETEFGGIGVLPAGGSLPQGVRSGVANPLAYGLAHVVG